MTSTDQRPAEHDRRSSRSGRARAGGALLGFTLGAAVVVLMHRTLGDDALISVAYARTLAESGTWGVYPGLTANTQTSPLNVWVLAAGMAVAVGEPILVVCGVFCVCLAAAGWLATDAARHVGLPAAGGWLAIACVGTSPVVVSTVGLETCLGIVVLLGLTVAALRRRALLTGALVGVAVLVRPDLLVAAGVVALLLVRPTTSGPTGPPCARRLVAAAGVAVAVVVPWHLWSWFTLGGAVPDTMWVRTADATGPGILGAIPVWARLYPAPTAASVLLVLLATGLAVRAWARRREPWAIPVLALTVAAWAYLLALAAVSAQGASWYYGPTVALAAVAVGLSVAALGRTWARSGLVVVGVASAIGVVAAGPVPWTWLPLAANYARTEQYAAIATQLPTLTGDEPVAGPGEVGALAFYGRVPVLDFLTEPARTEVVMCERAAAGGARATLMRWSAHHRAPAAARPTRWRLVFDDVVVPATSRVVATWPLETPVRGRDSLRLVETLPPDDRPAAATC